MIVFYSESELLKHFTPTRFKMEIFYIQHSLEKFTQTYLRWQYM